MKDLETLEKRLEELKEELKEVNRRYPYDKRGFYPNVEAVILVNDLKRKLFNVRTNINQVKMRQLNH